MARKTRKQPLLALPASENKHDITYRAGLYLRLSVESQAEMENNSLGHQKEICMDYLREKPEIQIWETYIATENALLAITSLGLDGAWLAVAPIRERMEIADAVLGIGSDLHAFAPVPFGYPGENRKQEDRFHAERVHYL